MSARPHRAGFTLVEVLVSLAIFALAAVVLGAAYVNVLTNYHAVASRPARDVEIGFVRQQLLLEPDLAKAERGGELTQPDGRRVRWRARIEPAAVADLFVVVLECEFLDSGTAAPRLERENFLLLRPTWSDPAEREQRRATTRQWLEQRKF